MCILPSFGSLNRNTASDCNDRKSHYNLNCLPGVNVSESYHDYSVSFSVSLSFCFVFAAITKIFYQMSLIHCALVTLLFCLVFDATIFILEMCTYWKQAEFNLSDF